MGRKKDSKTLLDAFEKALRTGQFSKSGDEYVIRCPFCDDNTGHHYVNLYKKVSYCFNSTCHASTAFKTNFIGHSIRSLLADEFNAKKHRDRSQEGIDLSCPLIPITKLELKNKSWLNQVMQLAAKRAYSYCVSRGMTHKQIEAYKVSIKPYEGRVYFPYWNGQGEMMFWMGRALSNLSPKTVEKRNSDKPLFGRHVKRVGNGPVVLVEGVFDHFATPSSYALMGSSITRSQIDMLLEDKINKVFFIADPDAGQAMHNMSAVLAKNRIEAYPVQLIGTDKDPAELGRKIMSGIVKELMVLDLVRPQVLRINLLVNQSLASTIK